MDFDNLLLPVDVPGTPPFGFLPSNAENVRGDNGLSMSGHAFSRSVCVSSLLPGILWVTRLMVADICRDFFFCVSRSLFADTSSYDKTLGKNDILLGMLCVCVRVADDFVLHPPVPELALPHPPVVSARPDARRYGRRRAGVPGRHRHGRRVGGHVLVPLVAGALLLEDRGRGQGACAFYINVDIAI